MPVVINGHELEDREVEQEMAAHRDAADPARMAVIALILRRLVREEADRLGLTAADDDALAQALLDRETTVPAPDEATCRRYYDAHPAAFRAGEWADVDHILFQVTPRVPLDALRELARQTLEQVRERPETFAAVARESSNCPSAATGGTLGRLYRGETVPEFERAVLTGATVGVLPNVVETRHGLHVVRVSNRCVGERLPFESVHAGIAAALDAAARDRVWKQYASLLIGRAKIEGIDLAGADSPLVQ